MAKDFKMYKLTIGSLIYGLRLDSKIYSGVVDALGISLAADSDNFTGIGTIADLRAAGKLVKVSATGINDAKTVKRFRLWCASTQLDNAIAKLPNKTIGEFKLRSAGLAKTTRYR
jgi:hypothetical protein